LSAALPYTDEFLRLRLPEDAVAI